jgi:hypothetical protein
MKKFRLVLPNLAFSSIIIESHADVFGEDAIEFELGEGLPVRRVGVEAAWTLGLDVVVVFAQTSFIHDL